MLREFTLRKQCQKTRDLYEKNVQSLKEHKAQMTRMNTHIIKIIDGLHKSFILIL